MDCALYNYKEGSQKEVTANDSIVITIHDSQKCDGDFFECPFCHEEVHLTSKATGNYFCHYKKEDIECDLRVNSNSSFSVYEKIGLPIYLRKKNNKFVLTMGFRALHKFAIDRAIKENISIDITDSNEKHKVTYLVNNDRFFTNNTTFLDIKFIPKYDTNYKIKFSSGNIPEYLKKYWSDYSDGFSYYGALFSSNEQGGRKVKHGDVVTTNREYFWVRKQNKLPTNWDLSNEILQIGEKEILQLQTKETYYVFKVQFKTNKFSFRKLYVRLKIELGVSLLFQQPEIIPLWPPCIKKSDGFNYIGLDKENPDNHAFCIVHSANKKPNIFKYEGDMSNSSQLNYVTENDAILLQIPISERGSLINVDTKLSANGSYFQMNDIELKKRVFELFEENGDERRCLFGLHECKYKKSLKILSKTPVNIYKISTKGNITQFKEINNYYTITDLKSGDRLFVSSHNNEVYVLNILENKHTNKNCKYSNLLEFMKIHKNDAQILMSKDIRKKILLFSGKKKNNPYIKKMLETNKIPCTLFQLKKGDENNENRRI